MYNKARLMRDEETAKAILASKTAAEAKTQGRAVKNFKQMIWDTGQPKLDAGRGLLIFH